MTLCFDVQDYQWEYGIRISRYEEALNNKQYELALKLYQDIVSLEAEMDEYGYRYDREYKEVCN